MRPTFTFFFSLSFILFYFTAVYTLIMRSKFKDEHPFGKQNDNKKMNLINLNRKT